MARGCLTNEIKEKYNITLKQLRLLPYFQYLLMNESRLDASKIDAEERAILQQWRDEGKITFSISEPCTCTKEFWNWMNEILWESYVPQKEEEIVKWLESLKHDIGKAKYSDLWHYEQSIDEAIKALKAESGDKK